MLNFSIAGCPWLRTKTPFINGFDETSPEARTLEKSPFFIFRKLDSTSTDYGCEAANWHACLSWLAGCLVAPLVCVAGNGHIMIHMFIMCTTSEAANREGINIDTVSHSLQMPLLFVMIASL
jgi:hypothetical protein